jgi:two-component system nitrate/nitrite response regulator NarL
MRILVVDDHQLLCVALSAHLERVAAKLASTSIEVQPTFTLAEALEALGSPNPPDLVFLDLNLGDGNRGAETLERLQAGNPRKIPIAVFTGLDPNDGASLETFRRCIQLNAAGILLKGANLDSTFIGIGRLLLGEFFVPPEILKMLASSSPENRSADSHFGLSRREWTIADGITRGLQNKAIAREQNLSEAYVRQVVTQIFDKLGVRTRTQAAMKLAGKNSNSII